MVIVLDTFATSSPARIPGNEATTTDHCHAWVVRCESAGHKVLVPAIAYYEVLREMERRQATHQIERLKLFCLNPKRFLALTTGDLELAAQLWADVRRNGRPTAAPQALDCDAILAAQTLNLGIRPPDLIVATTNAGHLSRFVPADHWTNIQP